jgi:L-methionine (R)-S-oxide reductase
MQEFNWWWVGFYWVKAKNTALEHLALGQFQGPPACTKLFKGTGVCAWAWTNKQSIVLADVEKFEGHVACSSVSKSEIVIPILQDG